MREQDIYNRFTEIVNEYLSKGMTFSVTMSGHQGEVMKVDLTDGVNTYRLRVENQSDIHSDMDALIIIVEKFNCSTNNRRWKLWSGNGEQILKEVYWNVAKTFSGKSPYYVSNNEIIPIMNKKMERDDRKYDCTHIRFYYRAGYPINYSKKYTDNTRVKIALKYIRKQPKCKTKKVGDIEYVIRTMNGYNIYLTNGTIFKLR